MSDIELYTSPSSFEPLLPSTARSEFANLTCDIIHEAGKLSALIPSQIVQKRIAKVVREMNSYYSNLIEGHKTYPRDIERALQKDYADQPVKRANQHLARAHIEVEEAMLKKLEEEPRVPIHSTEFIQWIHREFYQRLPADLQVGQRRNGETFAIGIGEWRNFEVTVGDHQPPHHCSIPVFMRRFEEFYGGNRIFSTSQLIAIAAAHHRLAWIHPFGDGNGRVSRLHTHAWLTRCKVGGHGLWTISRGLARNRQEYYEHLAAADYARRSDIDGRGNLSEQGLAEFCLFFLRCVLDQIKFMTGLLGLQTLTRRIEAHLHVTYADWTNSQREQVGRLLKAALVEGEIERGEVPLIIGRQATTASAIIKLALNAQLLDSPNEVKGKLALVFSSRTLESYFPQLYQDLPEPR